MRQIVNSDNARDFFSLRLFRDFRGLVPHPRIHFTGKKLLEIGLLIDKMLDEFTCKQTGYRTVLFGYTQVLLTEAFRAMREGSKEGRFL